MNVKTYTLLSWAEQLIAMAEDHRLLHKDAYNLFERTSNNFVEEWCTIVLALPRQMGNSTIAAHLSKKLKNITAVVVPYATQIEVLKRYGVLGDLMPMEHVRSGKCRGKPLGTVVVDGASALHPGDVSFLAEMVEPKEGWLILVG